MSSNLTFQFRGKDVPVTFPTMPHETAKRAIDSPPFQNWVQRCEASNDNGKTFEIHSVEIQSVDMFGARGVGFVKIKSDTSLRVEGTEMHTLQEHRLPGICFLRGNAVTIFVALFCNDEQYTLLVEQPRVPIGEVSCLELPAGMLDDEKQSIAGIAVSEMREECGIEVHPKELIDLTALASGNKNSPGIAHSPGGCDEHCRYFYLEKRVTPKELEQMKGRLHGLREHGEFITLRVVPMKDAWKSLDAKAIISLFLTSQLRADGKLPAAGELASPLCTPEPTLTMNNDQKIPQLAFGLYKVPSDEHGEEIILNAIKAGYRHFDTASFYANEDALGRACKKSGIPRQEFFITSKVWNEAVKGGRAAVRESVEDSIKKLDFGGYFDLFLVHWPVPGHFEEAYKELESLQREGKLKSIGLSNFSEQEFQDLIDSGITIQPAVNQFEVSPVMYRKDMIDFFQQRNVLVCASKPLNRAACLAEKDIVALADKYSVTGAQLILRWGIQHGLIIAPKTATPTRMTENRSILNFTISNEDMELLDSLTTKEALEARAELEIVRKTSL